MSKQTTPTAKKAEAIGRYMTKLPQPLEKALLEVGAKTGVSMSDLLRQGAVRIINEVRQTGGIQLQPLAGKN